MSRSGASWIHTHPGGRERKANHTCSLSLVNSASFCSSSTRRRASDAWLLLLLLLPFTPSPEDGREKGEVGMERGAPSPARLAEGSPAPADRASFSFSTETSR
jgi:hypothetical protein